MRFDIEFGAGVHSAKALQIALSPNEPEESADREGKVRGVSLFFNMTASTDRVCEKLAHPYTGLKSGMFLGPDPSYESSHQGSCMDIFSGLSTRRQLALLTHNSHEQNQSQENKYLPSVDSMGADRFCFFITLLDELENEIINRRALDRLVKKIDGNKTGNTKLCYSKMWVCGRCFCKTPLRRCFDGLGIVGVFHMFEQSGSLRFPGAIRVVRKPVTETCASSQKRQKPGV